MKYPGAVPRSAEAQAEWDALPDDLKAWQQSLPKCVNCGSPLDDDAEEAPWCGVRCKDEDIQRERAK